MKRISVIIPVYNTADYLGRCMDSILPQEVHLKEIILIDDGSRDESGEICDLYAKEHPQLVRVIHQKNQGAAAARNCGIETATGEFLSFIDSDDYLEPDMYERLLGLIDEYNADMAAAAVWSEQLDGSRFCRVPPGIRCCWNTKEAMIELNSYRYFYNAFWNLLISRKALGLLRFPPLRQSEDYAMLHKMIASCKRVAYCSKPVYHYIQRPNSVSRTGSVSLQPINIAKEQLLFYEEQFPDIAYVARTDCAFTIMGIYTAYLRGGMRCPDDLLKKLRRECLEYLPSVLGNTHIPSIKKLQALTFFLMPPLYRFIIKRTTHRNFV